MRLNALVNSGFETLTPQLLIPQKLAKELGLWPRLPQNYVVKEYMSPGGVVKLYVLREELEVNVVVEYEVKPVICDALISFIEEEVLISDKLAGALGIIVLYFAKGLWRLKTDRGDVVRKSYPKQTW